MTTPPQTDDPRGYRLDLADALADASPAGVALALARCVSMGVSVPDELAARAAPLLPAVPELIDEIGQWQSSARTLGARWTAADDPWEADELIRGLVELRADAEGLLAVVGEALRPAVAAFDDALRSEEGLLATADGSAWMEELRRTASALSPAAWWLHPVPEPADLPPPEYLAVVRRVEAWKAGEPAAAGMMAASTRQPDRFRTFVWRSPDGRYTATLAVYAKLTDADRRGVPTPLMFERGPGDPAAELSGTPIRLGSVSGRLDGNGEVAATVERWWADSDGRLYVGDPGTEWPLVTDGEGLS